MRRYYEKNHIEKARKFLSQYKKYQFIIDQIVLEPNTKLIEYGCSLGYLTSFFLMKHIDIIGVDISNSAVTQANKLFGPYFQRVDNKFFKKYRHHYDYVFHTGTIGCVQHPIQFTKQILTLLKPGGKLLFNAPDKKAASEMGAIWIKGTPPPDLITLFDDSFWSKFFSDLAAVKVSYEPYSHVSNAKKALNRFFRRHYLGRENALMYSTDLGVSSALKIESLLYPILYAFSKLKLVPTYRNEYGMFVSLTKK
jgi:SAM-dependent methyltransferase